MPWRTTHGTHPLMISVIYFGALHGTETKQLACKNSKIKPAKRIGIGKVTATGAGPTSNVLAAPRWVD